MEEVARMGLVWQFLGALLRMCAGNEWVFVVGRVAGC